MCWVWGLKQLPLKHERQTVSNFLKINSNYQPKFPLTRQRSRISLLLFINEAKLVFMADDKPVDIGETSERVRVTGESHG